MSPRNRTARITTSRTPARRFGALAVGVGLTLSLAACGSDEPAAQEGPGKVVWSDAGGPSTEAAKSAILDPFTAKTGITIETISPSDVAQIRAMVSAGNTIWDIASVAPATVLANCGTLFDKVDPALYDSLDKYPEGSITDCQIPTNKSAVILAYNTELFPDDPPTSIGDFFDTEKYPGSRLVVDDAVSNGLYEAALVADGVDPEEVYPLDFARAEAKMDTIKSDLVFIPTYSAAQAELESNKHAMTLMLMGRLIAFEKTGAKLNPVWDFTKYVPGAPAIVKDAPNLANAQQLVAFATSKDVQLDYAASNGVYPFHPDVKPEEVPYTDQQRKWSPFEEDRGSVILADPAWFAENTNQLIDSYTKWKVG